MADLLGSEVDLFVDPAEVHSYGLPALEALASGCHVLTRDNKGIHEYEHSWDGRVYIENDFKTAASLALNQIFPNYKLAGDREGNLFEPRQLAIRREEKVDRFIEAVFPEKQKTGQKIEVVTPNLRKHGGPTTIITMTKQLQDLGHDVSMSTIYTDWNPEVLDMSKGIDVRTSWKEVPEGTEIVIVNSDNPFAKELMDLHPDKKFIMYKLSHNARFKQIEAENLNLPWAHIMTSTGWLRNACLELQPEWEHKTWEPNKVSVVGWYHYGHGLFNIPPTNRTYGNGEVGFRLGTLIHGHPLKGSSEAIAAINGLKKKYEAKFHPVGFGEMKAKLPGYLQYVRSASRKDMAYSFKQLDVWLGASHTEGLGRLSLEAMSAGVAVVTTDTGAEFLRHEENCLLYPPGDPQAGAEAVSRLVQDKDLFIKLVVNGHATAAAAADPTEFRKRLNAIVNAVSEKG
jgi:glycosyltransferase involved in cell wall biosynthesis